MFVLLMSIVAVSSGWAGATIPVAAENPAMPGWVMLHSSCSVVMRIPNIRPFREIEMFLSRPRATFDKEAEDVQ